MSKKVLIVGGAGYLGGALTDVLAQTGHDFLVYDVLLYEESYRKPIPFVRGDVRDEPLLQRYLDWADEVIWLAALVGDPACALNESLTRAINVTSVEYLRDHFKGPIVYVSTCSVYGAAETELNEESELNPLSLYAQTKLEAERVLQGSRATIFRLGTLYGVSDVHSRIRFDLVVNTLVMRAALHRKISVYGGMQYRPLVHVRDVADLIASCIDAPRVGLYNVHAENMTIATIADHIVGHFPDVQVDRGETLFQDNRNYRVSSDKARTELNFVAKYSVQDGIKELKQLIEEGRIKDSFITRFSNYLYLRPLITEYQSPLGKVVTMNL
ncbi:MAG: NAD(P)-dependent oxidoreductase [bacterium]|nr:NAD(P)-dependent oxidoreductase [bacterium]